MAEIVTPTEKSFPSHNPLHPAISTPQAQPLLPGLKNDPLLALRKVRSSSEAYSKPSQGAFSKKASWLFSKFGHKSSSPKLTTPDRVASPSPKPPISLIPEPIPSLAKLSPEFAAGSLASPTEEITNLDLEEPEKSGFLVHTLRKFRPSSDTLDPSLSPSYKFESGSRLNCTVNKPTCSVPELKDVSTTRVNFAAQTFLIDPPQQIPSKKPKKGTVQVDETGVVCRPCVATSIYTPVKNYQTAASAARIAAYNSGVSTACSVRADWSDRSEKKLHLLRSRANSVVKQEESSDEDESEGIDTMKQGLTIDKPMPSKSECSEASDKPAKTDLTDIYTRCCHLREIMPIRATLHQLENRSGTLPFLRLLNPRPTMIEVLAFSDFIAIVPINTIVLNRIDINEEMFKHLMLSLAHNPALCKVALKNVNITPESWKILMAFLLTNKTVQRLDISLADPEDYNKKTCKYYKLDLFDRAQLDWKLLTDTLVARGGIEELILNGCLIPHDQFKDLISRGCSINTKRLGVASSALEAEDLMALSKWTTQEDMVCEGIDLGGNDLSNSADLIQTLFSQSSVLCVSLNSCNLQDVNKMEEIMGRTYENSQVRFLDLSYNPKLYPKISTVLSKYLPKFKHLRRFHADHDSLTSQEVITLAETFAQCPLLCHVSLQGNRDINAAAAESLATAVKLSSTITCVDVDSDLIPPNIQRRLTHYCMENMESMIHEDEIPAFTRDAEEDGELLDNGTELVKAVKYVVDSNEPDHLADDSSMDKEDRCMLVTDGLASRAKAVREKVRRRIQSMVQNSNLEQLNEDLRAKLIKLYYLDETLQQVLNKYDLIQQKFANSNEMALTRVNEPSMNKAKRIFDQADTMLEVAKQRSGEQIHIPKMSKTSRSSSFSSLQSVNVSPNTPPSSSSGAATPPPPPASGYYQLTPDGDVHMLRSNPTESSVTAQMRKQQKEEGDIHKISVYMRQNKGPIQETHGATGEALRKLFLSEAEDKNKSKGSLASASSASNNSECGSSTTSGSSCDAVQKAITMAVAAGVHSDGEGEVDVDRLIARLKDMSDSDIQKYFKAKYMDSFGELPQEGCVNSPGSGEVVS